MNSKQYTFSNLFEAEFMVHDTKVVLSKIEIPRIQRDYAQGRKSAQRIRTSFLDALSLAITKTPIVLDFIYGDIDGNGTMIPLDGQQRLTTLFLLHWYIAKKENVDLEDTKFLEHFTYTTRFSARDFCIELVKFSPDFSNSNISEQIKNQYWYSFDWCNDPTIISMLVMIDAIDEKFKNINNVWEALISGNAISFYFLPLVEMGLTDDLYIKMNSRGKPLTLFEHFKAYFEDILKETVGKEKSDEINHKFDIEWTDMFWHYRAKNNSIDDDIIHYFRYISDIICWKSGLSNDRDIDVFDLAKKLYSIQNLKAKDNIEYLEKCFDCWCEIDRSINIDSFFNDIFSGNKYESGKVKIYNDSKNLFIDCCRLYEPSAGRNRSFSLSRTLLLFGVLVYLMNKDKITVIDFKNRIRIVRNLIWNSEFEVREDRMKKLLCETETLILSGKFPDTDINEQVLGYNVSQKIEECKKQKWLNNNPESAESLYRLEDHNLLYGCISIVGLGNSVNFDKFCNLFAKDDRDLINRALLSIGDYSQHISWRSQYQIGVKNESSWEALFHPTKNRNGFEKTSRILNALLSTNKDLQSIVDMYLSNNPLKDWRYYLVKYSSMRMGNYGMYYIKDVNNPYEIILLNQTQRNGRNWNIFLKTIFEYSKIKSKLKLGEYAYQEDGNRLELAGTDISVECLNNEFDVYKGEEKIKSVAIKQENGVDLEDRVDVGKDLINKLLSEYILEGSAI